MPFTGIEESKVGTNKGTQDGPAKNGYRVAPDQFTDERVLARFENGDDVSLHEVEILLAEFVRLVLELFVFASQSSDTLRETDSSAACYLTLAASTRRRTMKAASRFCGTS